MNQTIPSLLGIQLNDPIKHNETFEKSIFCFWLSIETGMWKLGFRLILLIFTSSFEERGRIKSTEFINSSSFIFKFFANNFRKYFFAKFGSFFSNCCQISCSIL